MKKNTAFLAFLLWHVISYAQIFKSENEDFIKNLKDEFSDFYLLPEGGTNALAIKGCEEILTEEDRIYDVICTAVGTGGTISGIINSINGTLYETFLYFELGYPLCQSYPFSIVDVCSSSNEPNGYGGK